MNVPASGQLCVNSDIPISGVLAGRGNDLSNIQTHGVFIRAQKL
jgi:hypothetical protein